MKNSNLIIVRGGMASGKVAYARQLSESEGYVALDLTEKIAYGTLPFAGVNLFEEGSPALVRRLLDAGCKVAVAATFATKEAIEPFAALSPDALVVDMNFGANPPDWEAYPDAILVQH